MAAAIDPEAVRSALVARFREAADPARAKSMQAYMKTTMAFWGEVLAFVRAHQDQLSGLSKREALEHFPEKTRAALL